MRWRIKFVVLGLAVIFGAHLYVRSQAILFSAHDLALSGVESSGLLIGCLLLALAYARTGLRRDRRVPLAGGPALVADGAHRRRLPLHRRRPGAGRAALRRSGELPVPGVRRARWAWPAWRCCCSPTASGSASTAFVGRHFAEGAARLGPDLDGVLAAAGQREGSKPACARRRRGSFPRPSRSCRSPSGCWTSRRSSSRAARRPRSGRASAAAGSPPAAASAPLRPDCGRRSAPFDLEAVNEPWAEELRQLNPTTFPNGGNRWCVPLRTGEQSARRPRPGRPRQRRALHGRGTGAAAVHRATR